MLMTIQYDILLKYAIDYFTKEELLNIRWIFVSNRINYGGLFSEQINTLKSCDVPVDIYNAYLIDRNEDRLSDAYKHFLSSTCYHHFYTLASLMISNRPVVLLTYDESEAITSKILISWIAENLGVNTFDLNSLFTKGHTNIDRAINEKMLIKYFKKAYKTAVYGSMNAIFANGSRAQKLAHLNRLTDYQMNIKLEECGIHVTKGMSHAEKYRLLLDSYVDSTN